MWCPGSSFQVYLLLQFHKLCEIYIPENSVLEKDFMKQFLERGSVQGNIKSLKVYEVKILKNIKWKVQDRKQIMMRKTEDIEAWRFIGGGV